MSESKQGSFKLNSSARQKIPGKIQDRDDSFQSQHEPKDPLAVTRKKADASANVTPDDNSSLTSQAGDKAVASKEQETNKGSERMICSGETGNQGEEDSFECLTEHEIAQSKKECQKSQQSERVEDSVSGDETGGQEKNENKRLDRHLQDKQKEIEELKEEIKAKEQECSKFQDKNEQLNDHLQDKEKEIGALKETITSMEERLSKLQEETKHIISEKGKLHESIANHTEEMSRERHERGQLEHQIIKHRQQNEALKQQIATNMADIKGYQQENKELKMEIDSLSSRLAKEMNTKLSASEDSLENVSIKNRPMKVAEDFANFCTKEWQDMKQGIDNILSSDIEHYKLQLLTDILMVAHEKAQETIQQLHAVLQNPMILKRTKDTPPEPATKKNLPDALVSALGDFLKTSSEHSTNILQEAIKDELQKKCETQEEKDTHISAVWPICKDFDQMKKYISGAASLAWNMAVQRPSMMFSVEGIGKRWLGDKKQDIYWGSDDPKDESAKVKCYAHPILYHGDSLMARGKVMVKKQM